jgi:hypothetical protein
MLDAGVEGEADAADGAVVPWVAAAFADCEPPQAVTVQTVVTRAAARTATRVKGSCTGPPW